MVDNTGNSTPLLFETKVKQESQRELFSCAVSSRHKGAFDIAAGGLQQQQQQYLLSKTSENTNPSKQPWRPEKRHPAQPRVQLVQSEMPQSATQRQFVPSWTARCWLQKEKSPVSQFPQDSYKPHANQECSTIVHFRITVQFLRCFYIAAEFLRECHCTVPDEDSTEIDSLASKAKIFWEFHKS